MNEAQGIQAYAGKRKFFSNLPAVAPFLKNREEITKPERVRSKLLTNKKSKGIHSLFL